MGTITTTDSSKPFRETNAGEKIPSGSSIIDTLEVAITDAAWAAVSLGAAQYCKAILINTRNNTNWYLSAQAAGTRYFTVAGQLAIDIAGKASETLFYAKATAGNDTTLEVILLD